MLYSWQLPEDCLTGNDLEGGGHDICLEGMRKTRNIVMAGVLAEI
jgi:hypothetical protein